MDHPGAGGPPRIACAELAEHIDTRVCYHAVIDAARFRDWQKQPCTLAQTG